MTERRPRRRPGPAPVIWGSLALFGVLFVLLAYQLSVASGSASRPVVLRKVIERRVVTTASEPGEAESEAPVVTAPPLEETAPEEAAPVITSAS